MADPQILNEDVIDLEQAAELARVHMLTVYRWCTRGVHGIHLEHLRSGRILTSRQALERFLAARTKQDQRRPGPQTKGQVKERVRVRLSRHEADEAEARDLGI